MRIRSVVAATSLVAAGGLAAAAPASADLVTYCHGEGGPVTVPTDLVVAEGDSCYLTGTTIEGDVRIEASADLVVVDGTLNGAVDVAEDGYFDVRTSAVDGDVNATDAYGIYLDASQLAASVSSAGSDPAAFLFAFESGVDGAVSATSGEFLVTASQVGGDVTGVGALYTDVHDSTIGGALTVENNELGGVFCDSEVDGAASYQGNSDVVQLGADGPMADCEQMSYFGGDLDVSDNSANVVVSNNIIRGDLSGTGNDPAPRGENNRVRGAVSGQFQDLTPPADVRAFFAPKKKVDHQDKLERQVDDRRADAKAAAKAAGPAQL